MVSRLLAAAVLYLVSGTLIGYFNPRAWQLAGLTILGTVLLGLVGLISSVVGGSGAAAFAHAFALLASPAGLAFLGGYLGVRAGKRRAGRWLLGRLFRRHQSADIRLAPLSG